MKTVTIPLTLVSYDLGGGNCLIEALEFPELSFCENVGRAQRALIARIESYCRRTTLDDLWRREIRAPVEVTEETISLPASKKVPWWIGELSVRLAVVRWTRADGLLCAVVPAIESAASGGDPSQLEKRLQHEIRSALNRLNLASNLKSLVQLNLRAEVQFTRAEATLHLPTLLEKAYEEEELTDKKASGKRKPVLPEVAQLLTASLLEPAFEMTETELRMLEKLQAPRPRSILLVGKSGAGKTAAFRDLARIRSSLGLGSTQFWETSGARIVAGMSGFGMWQERCMQIVQEVAKTKCVLHFGNLAELAGVGQSVANETSIASFLRTYLDRGDLTAVCECTPAEYLVLQRSQPHIISAFDVIEIREPSWSVVRSILEQSATFEGRRRRARVTPEAIEEVVRLHRRYGGYSAIPGRPLRFLKNLVRDCSRDPRVLSVVTEKEVLIGFTRETGLPASMIDDRIPMETEGLRGWFGLRIVGQPGAINRIVEILARIKARLSRPQRPIASLMFVGPTGVGKTETAKALAEFLFGDKGRMTRFDMSEYSDPIAVRRLIGGLHGSEGLLTAKVREQPFSVLLLDECEKSDPSFFDLLLQVLGEARLTDSTGREADFSNCVVILTSNLGAEGFLRGSVGFGASGDRTAEAHFSDEARRFFRPELFNRLDEIIPFSVLDRSSVRQIAEIEFEQIRKRDAFATVSGELHVELAVCDAFAAKLQGDPYGARPLKREIEREVLIPLARTLGQKSLGKVSVILAGEQISIRNELPGSLAESTSESGREKFLRSITELRRWSQGMNRSPQMRALQNEVFKIDATKKYAARRKWVSAEMEEKLAQHARLTRLVQAVHGHVELLGEWERDAVAEYYVDPRLLEADKERLGKLELDLRRTADLLLSWDQRDADRILLAILGDRIWWSDFAELYLSAFPKAEVALYLLQQRPAPSEPDALVWETIRLAKVQDYSKAGEEKRKKGLLLEIKAPAIGLLLAGEQGSHTIKMDASTSKTAFIDTFSGSVSSYRPPEEVDVEDSPLRMAKVRRFDREKRMVDDRYAGKLSWGDESLSQMLLKALEGRMAGQRKQLFGT